MYYLNMLIVYLNDIVVYNQTLEDHVAYLCKVL